MTQRVITLKTPYTFADALAKLLAGECLGIRPQDNLKYLVPLVPTWMKTAAGTDFLLSWNHWDPKQLTETSARCTQLLGEWFLVIVDHRYLKPETSEV